MSGHPRSIYGILSEVIELEGSWPAGKNGIPYRLEWRADVMRHVERVKYWHLVIEYHRLLLDRAALFAASGILDIEEEKMKLLGRHTQHEKRMFARQRRGLIDRARMYTRWIRGISDDPRFERAHNQIQDLKEQGHIMSYSQWCVS